MSIVKEFPFSTHPIIDKGKVIQVLSRPIIPIQLTFNGIMNNTPIACWLDSGCDNNLFPADWATLIGIYVDQGEVAPYMGIGSSSLTAYRHFVNLSIPDTNINFNTYIDFSSNQQIPLLGRAGFFTHFKKIIFDEEKEKFILEF